MARPRDRSSHLRQLPPGAVEAETLVPERAATDRYRILTHSQRRPPTDGEDVGRQPCRCGLTVTVMRLRARLSHGSRTTSDSSIRCEGRWVCRFRRTQNRRHRNGRPRLRQPAPRQPQVEILVSSVETNRRHMTMPVEGFPCEVARFDSVSGAPDATLLQQGYPTAF
jgi:hypothetical protein